MLFKGTVLTRGSGVGVVVATGVATELGRISRSWLKKPTWEARRWKESWLSFLPSWSGLP